MAKKEVKGQGDVAQQPAKTFNMKFTFPQLVLIINGLTKLPYEQSADTIKYVQDSYEELVTQEKLAEKAAKDAKDNPPEAPLKVNK